MVLVAWAYFISALVNFLGASIKGGGELLSRIAPVQSVLFIFFFQLSGARPVINSMKIKSCSLQFNRLFFHLAGGHPETNEKICSEKVLFLPEKHFFWKKSEMNYK